MMEFLKKKKKLIIEIVSATFVLFLGSTQLTHAALFSLDDIAYTAIGKIIFGLSFVLASFAGIIIGIQAWLIGVVLNMNSGIFQTVVVQTGFSTSLAVANLGFVLGIIVIAIATIIRHESYGIKQLLWKFIVAAILVNFGLVIMAPIVGVADNFTQYFLNCIAPTSGGCTGSGNGAASYTNFATKISTAFNPQKGLTSLNSLNASGTNYTGLNGAFSVDAADGAGISKMLMPIFSLVFVILSLGAIALTLGLFIAMLLIRYLYISILAVLLPFAWLMWVFPSLHSHWNKWWSEFIRWTFFAPIMMFFLYLALASVAAMGASQCSAGGSQCFTTYTSSSNDAWAAIANFFTNLLSPIIQNLLGQLTLVGLMLGGIYAANSMGIAMADVGMKAASGTGKAIGNYVGKQTTKGARAGFRRAGGEKFVKKLQSNDFNGKFAQTLRKIPLAGWAASRGASLAGRALEPHLNNADLVEASKKKLPHDTHEIEQNLKGNMNTEDQLAHIAKLVADGKLKSTTMVGNKTVGEFMDEGDNAKVFKESYGQEKLLKDTDVALLSNAAMRAEAKKIKKVTPTTAREVQFAQGNLPPEALAHPLTENEAQLVENRKAKENIESLSKDFWKDKDASDATKANANDLFTKKNIEEDPAKQAQALALIKTLITQNPDLTSSIYTKKMKSEQMGQFAKMFTSEATKQEALLEELIAKTPEGSTKIELEEKLKRVEKSKHRFATIEAKTETESAKVEKEKEPKEEKPHKAQAAPVDHGHNEGGGGPAPTAHTPEAGHGH